MRAQKDIEKRLLDIIEPDAEALGFDIVRLRVMGGNRPILQVMAEKAGGAPTDVEDCATLSRALSPLLDVHDAISSAYVLEVSTPGIDRPLTRKGDFARWKGHLAKVELARPIEGRRRFQGVITAEDDTGVTIELDDETELTAGLQEMTKASLILTDALIDAAAAAGTLPVQPDEEGFEDYEVEEDATDPLADEASDDEDTEKKED